MTAHMRKVFLVAERLLWDAKLMSTHDKILNEELNWKINFELGIVDPFVEDPDQVLGGKHSRANKFYPYQNEHEMRLALRYILMTEDITKTTWALWIGTQLDLQQMLGGHKDTSPSMPDKCDTIDRTVSHDPASGLATGKSQALLTTPSSIPKVAQSVENAARIYKTDYEQYRAGSSSDVEPSIQGTTPSRRIESYKSLQDFYSLLDKIERTSYVGALFLEAYAEKLRDDMCKSCWLKHNINLDFF